MMGHFVSARIVLSSTVLVVLLVAALWSVSSLLSTKQQAIAATRELDRTRRLATTIKQLRAHFPESKFVAPAAYQPTLQVQQAAQEAGLPEGALWSVDLGREERETSQYMRQHFDVDLAPLSMQQLLSLIYHLATGPVCIHVNQMRLVAQESGPPGDQQRWLVSDLDLTYFELSPTSP